MRANLDLLYPDPTLEQAFVFRVTRSAELELDERGADDLLDEVARAAAQRGQGVAVRLEVERGMPPDAPRAAARGSCVASESATTRSSSPTSRRSTA